MALPADLDRIVKNIEHENQQIIKLIEQEKQQIEAIEKETEYEKERTAKLKESNSQLDDEIKRYHKQFLHLRDNCESLKKTAVILSEHEDVMVKKLDEVVIESERERIERDGILSQYRRMWDDYRATYEGFPEVKRLRSLQEELAEVEQIRLTTEEQVNQLRMKIKEKQEEKEAGGPPFATMEQFIVEVAEMKIGTMRVEQEIHQMCQEKRDVTRQIINVKEQLRTMEEQRLLNLAITEQEKSKQSEVEGSHINDSGQQAHEAMSIEMQPAVLPIDQMLQHEVPNMPRSQGQIFQPRKSPPKLLFPGMEEEISGAPQVGALLETSCVAFKDRSSSLVRPQTEMPLLRQLQVTTLTQKITTSEHLNFSPPRTVVSEQIMQDMKEVPSIRSLAQVIKLAYTILLNTVDTISQDVQSVSQSSQASSVTMPEVTVQRPPPLLMPRPPELRTQRPPQSPQFTMPRPPQMTPILPQSPQLTMPRPPQVMTPRPSPQLTIPRPQTPKLMMPRPQTFTPKIVTTPKVLLPQRARSTLPLDMIGTPGKSKDLPANVDTPQLPPPRPADYPRVSLPMDMIGDDAGHRIPQMETGETTITPERPDTAATAKTPTTPGDHGIALDPDDSPFNLEKHLRHLSELKSRSPGFCFSSRPMVQREPNAEVNHTTSSSITSSQSATPFHGQKSTISTSASSANPFNFGFNNEPNTSQPNFNFGAPESPINGTGFNFGRGDTAQGSQALQNNFSFGLGFGAGGDNSSGNIFSMFGDGGKDETPQSPQADFNFSGFGNRCESPSFNAGSGGGFNLF